MSPTIKKRNTEVDTVRGIACLLLVLFHVVGDTPNVGLRIPEGNWLQLLNESLAYLRMPIFSFLSGYVYGFRPYQGGPAAFIGGKLRRLLLPVLTVGTLFALVQASVPGANTVVSHWWLLHIEPVGHFWFLQALFIVFLVVLALEHFRLLATGLGFAAVWSVCALLFTFFSPPSYLGANGAVYLLPFFLAGLACKRFEIAQPGARLLALAVLSAAAALVWLLPDSFGQQTSLPALAFGVAGAFLLLRSGWRSAPLAWIGAYSFAIYLLHVFFTAGSRIVFKQLGVSDNYVLLLLGLTLGIAGPVLAAMLISRYRGLNLLLLGSSTKAKVVPA